MQILRPRRIGVLTLTLLAALLSAGCPELNRYPDRSPPGQFNVEDPAGRNAGREAREESTSSRSAGVALGRPQFMLSAEGGLPDQARRAQ